VDGGGDGRRNIRKMEETMAQPKNKMTLYNKIKWG
jgi:hypothetical protein